MRTSIKVIMVTITVLIALNIIESRTTPQAANPTQESQSSTQTSPSEVAVNVNRAKAAIKAEPKVKDVMYDPTQAVQWHIGVINDGTSRIGYASYLCDVIKGHNGLEPNRETFVRVVDIVAVTNGASFRKANLGTISCKTYKAL